MVDDDPFALFGDDDDDDDGGEQDESEMTRIAKSLVDSTNSKLLTSSSTIQTAADGHIDKNPGFDIQQLNEINSPWSGPMYLGPIRLVRLPSVGGGRGYVATESIPAGTLVMIDQPISRWPVEQLGKPLDINSVRHILEDIRGQEIVLDMEELHPTKRDVDQEVDTSTLIRQQIEGMMSILRSENNAADMSSLVSLAADKGIVSQDKSPLIENDILRLLLALRYNGLESGLYRHVAMLNHSCQPNVVKILPSVTEKRSEVRAIKRISAGETLCISYVPRVLCHRSRRKHLWEQHRFDIGANIAGDLLKMELVGGALPKSSLKQWDDDVVTSRIEKTVEEMQSMLSELTNEIETDSTTETTWETSKALEQSVLVLIQESIEQLNNENHILLIPILFIHVDSTFLVLKTPNLGPAVQHGILTRQLESLMKLRLLQTMLSGPDHFDLARTTLDQANVIGELLTKNPKLLVNLNLPSLDSFQQWSILENKARQEHKRLKAMYPYDADTFV